MQQFQQPQVLNMQPQQPQVQPQPQTVAQPQMQAMMMTPQSVHW